ncbi:MAG: transglutaminase domain-containing protein [Leptospiraceae bacterium]|nr:transglutaminase domain-containing protein [Leptospiraceae bacterium]
MYNIKAMVENLIDGCTTDREKAIKLHNFVRDNIRYGITKKLDFATPEYILESGYGHTTAKATLLIRLLREAGINAMHHFVTLKKEYIQGAFPDLFEFLIPPSISHAYVEVNVNGKYYHLDSFAFEKSLFNKLQIRLRDENKKFGYGISEMGTTEWNGESDAFAQFHPEILEEDHGTFEDPFDYYYEYPSYKHQLFGIQFSMVVDFLASFSGKQFEIWANSNLNHLRTY